MRPSVRTLSVLALGLASAAMGCGGGSDKGSSARADRVVDMKDIQFVPRDIAIRKGQTIEWTNSDSVPHNVTKDGGAGPDFHSPNVSGGARWRHTFASSGRFDYVCTIHPSQRGTVTVR